MVNGFVVAMADCIDWAILGLKWYRLGQAIRLEPMGAAELDVGVA